LPNVFVYGTLMFPEVAGPIAQIDSVGEPITIHGFKRFEAHTREWGNYPAIIRDASSSVDGLLFRNLTEKQLAQFDWFEDVIDGLYHREQIQVVHKNEPIDVQLYVCGPRLEKMLLEPLCKPWDPEVFRKNELERYVDEVVFPGVRSDAFASIFNN
jgi:gamma-glutamylcyclotransferase (GGCT)/AIG2-like uncharacterized protein YtfP